MTGTQEGDRLPDLPDAYLREIGRVAVTFNRLEAVLRLIIGALLGGDETTKDVAVHGDSFNQLLQKVDRLVPARVPDQPLRDEIAEWRQTARRANEPRRETIHSSWITLASEGDEALVLLHSRTGGPFRAGLLSADQLSERAKIIAAVGVWGWISTSGWGRSLPKDSATRNEPGVANPVAMPVRLRLVDGKPLVRAVVPTGFEPVSPP
jgi:hypothetical protein